MSNRSLRPLTVLIALAIAVAALLLPNVAAVGDTNGKVQGTFTAGGSALDQGLVQAFKVSAPDEYPAEATPYESSYSLSLPPGQYYLRYQGSAPGGPFAPEWWNDSPNRQGSTPVTITSGGTVTANVDLTQSGSIAGYVATDYQQVGIDDTTVDVYQQDSSYELGWVRLTTAQVSAEASDGKYLARNLPSGNYRLHFYSRITHYEGWWPNATSLASAESIPLTAPTAITGINPTLSPTPSISGKVTVASSGAPVGNAYVELYAIINGAWQNTSSYYAVTSPDGTYKIYAPADTYRVKFTPVLATKLRIEYWDNHTSVAVADNVVLGPGTAVTGINARLEKNTFHLTSAAKITGIYRVGQTLKAVPPRSIPTSTKTTYQWLRDGKPIAGTAAKRSYWKLVTADRHHKIGVKITLNRLGWVSLYRIVTKLTPLP